MSYSFIAYSKQIKTNLKKSRNVHYKIVDLWFSFDLLFSN